MCCLLHRKLFLFLWVIFTLIPLQGRAELIYQPAESEDPKKWEAAGSALLEGVGIIFRGLSELEKKKVWAAKSTLSAAQEKLGEAHSYYQRLITPKGRSPRIILDNLSDSRKEVIEDIFSRYNVEIPTNQSDVAMLAANQVEGLNATLTKSKSAFDKKNNLLVARPIITKITQLLLLGTYSAELMVSFENKNPARRTFK